MPLVVLSADRPHELRGSGASQTADAQARMFLPSVRYSADLPAPVDPAAQAPAWRSVVSRAVAAARGLRGDGPGPVHLDVGFSDPLTPSPDVLPVSTTGLTVVAEPAAPQPVVLDRGPRTLVLAGDAPDPATGRAARELAEHAGWPLLAEPSSGARGGERAVGPYRLLLDADDGQGRLGDVERVVLFGHPTLSRPVTRLLARDDVELIVVSPDGTWPDAGFRAARVVPAATVTGRPEAGEQEFAARWDRAAKLAADAVDAVVGRRERARGPLGGSARSCAPARPTAPCSSWRPATPSATSTSPATPAGSARSPTGARGIDGTLATAEGVATVLGPTRLLVGDLAFLHDVNAFLPVPGETRPDLTVVLVNDDGGGIFETLEHAAVVARPTFERVVATPHGVDVAALCAAYGVPHVRPRTRAEAAAVLATPPSGLRVVELLTDRAAVRPRLERITAAVRAAVLDA